MTGTCRAIRLMMKWYVFRSLRITMDSCSRSCMHRLLPWKQLLKTLKTTVTSWRWSFVHLSCCIRSLWCFPDPFVLHMWGASLWLYSKTRSFCFAKTSRSHVHTSALGCQHCNILENMLWAADPDKEHVRQALQCFADCLVRVKTYSKPTNLVQHGFAAFCMIWFGIAVAGPASKQCHAPGWVWDIPGCTESFHWQAQEQ